TCRQSMCTAR
nr:Chain B, acyl-enzyme intermediate of bicyclic peptide UK729 [unidentified]